MNQLFHIYELSGEEARRISIQPDNPHIHDYEELIVVKEGELFHFIDFKPQICLSPIVSFISKGKIHSLIPRLKDENCSVWVIQFKSEFIPETTFQLYSSYHNFSNIELKRDRHFDYIILLCEMMHFETQQAVPDFAVVKQLLSTLLIKIESERRKHFGNEDKIQKLQNNTFKQFLQILEDNFRSNEGVEFYANQLSISIRTLNTLCRRILQKSVSEVIETRKLIEAKNLLISTQKTISEIGYELGYNEKAYFTNVFKKKEGVTPTDFRTEITKIITE